MVEDSLGFEGLETDSVIQMMASMLATNTTVEECGIFARAEVMMLSEKPWLIFISVEGSFAFEQYTRDLDQDCKEQIILKASKIVMVIRSV